LRASGVAAAMERHPESVPRDPLFGPWFAAMLALTASGNDASAAATNDATEVLAVAARWSADRRWGPRMRELARQLEAAIPNARADRGVVWSMSTTYKL